MADRYKNREKRRTAFLPNLSLTGPSKTWPTAKPPMQKVRPSWMTEADVLKTCVISGKAGRYMSITNGPKPFRRPKNRTR